VLPKDSDALLLGMIKTLPYCLQEYITSGWNLNNLPITETSVLKYIDASISGMKVHLALFMHSVSQLLFSWFFHGHHWLSQDQPIISRKLFLFSAFNASERASSL